MLGYRFRMRIAAVVTSLVLALVLAGTPALGAARVAPDFFGVFADRSLFDSQTIFSHQTRVMSAHGVKTMGATFDWATAQPYATASDVPGNQRAAYPLIGGVPTSFDTTDRVVGTAAAARLRVFPVVIRSPGWARLNAGRFWSPPADPATYGAYLTALIGRYGPAGSFWAENPSVPRVPIQRWQVWNEPDSGDNVANSIFWADGPHFPARYLALLKVAHAAIKSADPNAQVVMGGLVGRSWQTMAGLYALGYAPYFDALALHTYTDNPHNVLRILRKVRDVMNQNRDSAKPIEITEMGWPAFVGEKLPGVAPQRLRKYESYWLRIAFQEAIAHRADLRLTNMLWYTWLGTDRGVDAFEYSGLVHLDSRQRATPKPALAAYTTLARQWEGMGARRHHRRR